MPSNTTRSRNTIVQRVVEHVAGHVVTRPDNAASRSRRPPAPAADSCPRHSPATVGSAAKLEGSLFMLLVASRFAPRWQSRPQTVRTDSGSTLGPRNMISSAASRPCRPAADPEPAPRFPVQLGLRRFSSSRRGDLPRPLDGQDLTRSGIRAGHGHQPASARGRRRRAPARRHQSSTPPQQPHQVTRGLGSVRHSAS